MYKQQTFEASSLQAEIIERGYAEFEHHISPDEISRLIADYGTFTISHPDPEFATMDAMLPAARAEDSPKAIEKFGKQLDELNRKQDHQGEWHKYRTNTSHIAKPTGYTNRSFQVAAIQATRGIHLAEEDSKEYYHFTPGHHAAMARNHEAFDWGPVPPEATVLDSAFTAVHTKASTLMMRICGMIEETHPEIRRIVTPKSLLISPIRLLFYPPSEREKLAAGHYDKGDLTLQLGESHEGLRIAPNEHVPLMPVIRNADKAVFFASLGLAEVFPDTPYQPAYHDVLRSNLMNNGQGIPPEAAAVCGRWALVFFATRVDHVDPDKLLIHRRRDAVLSSPQQ